VEATAVGIAAAVRSGQSSARAAVEQALRRIAEHDPALLAFRTVRVDQALAEADLVDADPGRAALPLAGVPIAIKDNVAVTGEFIGNGSVGSELSPQPADHEVVARLRSAGAVVVGLTNVPELCVFGATDSTIGITRNPWDSGRSPGGSSGGSAAAVAAGLVPVAHGNDGMGSIRIPAACTGLVGLKPGLGTVPSNLGNGSWFDMAEHGPLSTTVADCALVLSVMAGRPELADVAGAGPANQRIGVSVRAPVAGVRVDRDYIDATYAVADLLASAGHRVQRRELRYPLTAGPAAMARWFAGAEMDARLLADRSALERRVARHARLGRAVLAIGSPRPGGRTSWQHAAERYFEHVDVLLTPMLAQPPLTATAWARRGWAANVVANVRYAPFAAPWNLAGWPALAVPAGVHRSGLPLSVQLVARPGGEGLLLRLGAQLEQLRPWPRTAPGFGDPS
jgi:amidase